METRLTRRRLQRLALALPTPLALAVVGGHTAGITLAQDDDATATAGAGEATATPLLVATPTCDDGDDDTTPEQTEGPYYTPDSPERTSLLEPNLPGTPLTIAGYVYSTACRPVTRALVDFWHADDSGAYDNEGYRLRGHQFTDDDGRWQLETIVPGLYPGRTRHFHVKVQAPDQPALTTQLYFPDEPENDRDGIFDPALVLDVRDAEDGDGRVGSFSFVLDVD